MVVLGLHCLNKKWRIIYRAKAIDRNLIRQIIWAEISRTFAKLFLYMNQGRLHKKNSIKRGQGFGFHTASWTSVSAVLMLSTDLSFCFTLPLMQREECHLLSHLLRFLQLLPSLSSLLARWPHLNVPWLWGISECSHIPCARHQKKLPDVL